MRERKVFFTKEQSFLLRGIAIIMVVASHYVVWYGDLVTWEPLRYAVSRLGIYGVDIFFVVSGYGLAKVSAKRPVGREFVTGRLRNTYVPYLLLAGLMQLWEGGAWTLKRGLHFLTGYDFWFIQNILVFYLAFFLVFLLLRKNLTRLLALAVLVFLYSYRLAVMDRASFWFVSNLAFVIGVALALYEKHLIRIMNAVWPLQMLFLAVLLFWVAKSGMDIRFTPVENYDKMIPGMAASVVWTLFTVQLAGICTGRFGCLCFLGKISLELYLLHTFLYFEIVRLAGMQNRLLQGMAALAATIGMAWGMHTLLSLFWKRKWGKICV